MPNTVVTSTTNSVKVVFNDDSSKTGGINKSCFNKSDIEYFRLNGNHIEVIAGDSARWICSDTTNSINALIIDSVDGASPSSLSDLYDKLIALIA